MKVTVPAATPLVGETCSQLQAAVAGIEAWKLAPVPELVSVIACAAGTGPPSACAKLSGPGGVSVTVALEVIVRVNGIVTGLDARLGEAIVMDPLYEFGVRTPGTICTCNVCGEVGPFADTDSQGLMLLLEVTVKGTWVPSVLPMVIDDRNGALFCAATNWPNPSGMLMVSSEVALTLTLTGIEIMA